MGRAVGGARLIVDRVGDWQTRAACKGHLADLWLSEDTPPGEHARAICNGCPVRAECGRFALTAACTHGLYAGYDLGNEDEVAAFRSEFDPTYVVKPPAGRSGSATARICECGNPFQTRDRRRTLCTPCLSGLVLADTALEHMRQLRAETGAFQRHVAMATGLALATISSIDRELNEYISLRTEATILELTAAQLREVMAE